MFASICGCKFRKDQNHSSLDSNAARVYFFWGEGGKSLKCLFATPSNENGYCVRLTIEHESLI